MSGVEIDVARVPGRDPEVPLPSYETEGAAGMDLRANLRPEDRTEGLTLASGERALVPTGIALGIPAGWEVQIRPRSGLALKRGVTLVNAPGTIDSDYRGEIGVILINHGAEVVTVAHGERVAQMVAAPVARATLRETAALDGTARGAGGFGSTGSGADRS